MKHSGMNPSSANRMLLSAAFALTLAVGSASAQTEITPAPGSIGADIPGVYFGPAPSDSMKELVGPVQLLRSGTVDLNKATITLPLYRGQTRAGKNVWSVLTDTTDQGNATALGLNFSAKLNCAAVRNATLEKDGTLTFDGGTADFSPAWSVTPGDAPDFFPPKACRPGSVGDADDTPLVRIGNLGGQVYNAPILAYDVSAGVLAKSCVATGGTVDHRLTHDKVRSICPEGKNGGEVTLQLTTGFGFAEPVLYLSLDASDSLPAAMEQVTVAPALKDLTFGDDGAFSAVERLFAAVHGPTGKGNPQRQGFTSALGDVGVAGPLNVLGGIPTVATDCSPIWDLNVSAWTKAVTDAGYRARNIEEFQILGLAGRGFITGPGGGRFGSSGFLAPSSSASRRTAAAWPGRNPSGPRPPRIPSPEEPPCPVNHSTAARSSAAWPPFCPGPPSGVRIAAPSQLKKDFGTAEFEFAGLQSLLVRLPAASSDNARTGPPGSGRCRFFLTSFTRVCGHLSCTPELPPAGAHQLVCPCHGSICSADGTVVRGPVLRSLRALVLEIRGADVYAVALADA